MGNVIVVIGSGQIGQAIARRVGVGKHVLLADMRLDNANAALGRAEANLPALQSRVKRYEDALAEKAVSRQDYDDASAALKQAEADNNYWKKSVKDVGGEILLGKCAQSSCRPSRVFVCLREAAASVLPL